MAVGSTLRACLRSSSTALSAWLVARRPASSLDPVPFLLQEGFLLWIMSLSHHHLAQSLYNNSRREKPA